ncbi:MAG: 50S ribosomal protein L29 [Alphaproteobacteria bacterium]
MAQKSRTRKTEIRQMKDDVLKGEIEAVRTKLFDLRTQLVTAKVENTASVRETRRDIARLLTERRARQLAKGGK